MRVLILLVSLLGATMAYADSAEMGTSSEANILLDQETAEVLTNEAALHEFFGLSTPRDVYRCDRYGRCCNQWGECVNRDNRGRCDRYGNCDDRGYGRRFYVCFAENRRGVVYRYGDYDRYYAQQQALRLCEQRSIGLCRSRGCTVR